MHGRPPRVLFVADLNEYAKGFSRRRILAELGADVTALSHAPLGGERDGYPPVPRSVRALQRLGIWRDTEGVNRTMPAAAAQLLPDLVWIEKGNMVRPGTLGRLRRIKADAVIAAYSDDDMFLRHNRSRAFLAGLRHYDVVFTTKAPNAAPGELPALGARRVVVVDKAFDPHQHFPLAPTEAERRELGADVGFAGSFERDRAETLLFLAASGVRVRVWGNGWRAFAGHHPNLRIEYRAVVNTMRALRYSTCICATRINLGFLRKLNRDSHTDRSLEIPACGGFLLAERSADHMRLFAEDSEAVFFSDPDELLAKVRYYLAHEDERAAIARAGRRRCLDGGYGETERLGRMVSAALDAGGDGPAQDGHASTPS